MDLPSGAIAAPLVTPDAISAPAPLRWRTERGALGAGLALLPQYGARRQEAEQFIRRTFARAHGATIGPLMPEVLALRDPLDNIRAACGRRRGDRAAMFLEIYLSRPVEQVLEECTGISAPRRQISEIGNLAVSSPGDALHLIATLSRFLAESESTWVAFTAAAKLCNAFRRLGIRLHHLAPANAECLPAEERAAWGRYYDARPQVTAVSVAQANQALAALAP